MVIWITGLSGAGKTTIAMEVVRLLRERQIAVAMLDGDEIRAAIADPNVAHDRDSRLVNAMRLSRLAELVARQGITVVVSTMSLFREIHEWNRQHLPGYLEVYVKVSLETLRKRDPRGLYSRADRGETRNVAGIDLSYDEPATPDLVLDNEATVSGLTGLARKVLDHALSAQEKSPNGARTG